MPASPETILFYSPGTCSLAGMVALRWLGQPFALCRIEKEQRGSELYRRINPRALVPALRVDGRVLLESNAVLAHIADRAPGAKLLPPVGWERDLANQWLSYLASGFHPAFWPYFAPQRYAPDVALYDAVRASAVQAVQRELRFVNAHLQAQEFILGSAPSVLDAYLHAMDRWANKLVDMANDYPHVWRHQKALARDPGVRFATAVEHSAAAPAEGSFAGHVELAALLAGQPEARPK